MKILMLLAFLIVCSTGYSLGDSKDEVRVIDENHVVPKAIQDPATKIIFYLESDGRHISAISPDGKLLWSRDPFVDAKLKPYRGPHPIICYFNFVDPTWWKIHSYLGLADDFIGLGYNSSQFGAINKITGKFTWFGQD